jgi:hypothetical protein
MKWIKISDRFPDKDCEVLLWGSSAYIGDILICDGGPMMAIYVKGNDYFRWGNGDNKPEDDIVDIDSVSHWMDAAEIPAPD